MTEKERILLLLEKGKITVTEAIDMLDKLTDPDVKSYEEKSYEETIESIANDVVDDMDVDSILEIMQNMNWEYYFSGHVVTRDEVIGCMKDNVRYALNLLVKNKIENNDAHGSTGTGGFWCDAWVDDDDEDNIQIELYFQPFSGFGEGHLDELVKLKLQDKKE